MFRRENYGGRRDYRRHSSYSGRGYRGYSDYGRWDRYSRRGYDDYGGYRGYNRGGYGGYEDEEFPQTLGSRIYGHFEKKKEDADKKREASVKCVKYTFDNVEVSGDYVEIPAQEVSVVKKHLKTAVIIVVFLVVIHFGLTVVHGAETVPEQEALQTAAGTEAGQERVGVPVMSSESVCFYKEASTTSEVIYTLPAYRVVRALKQKGRFYKLAYRGQDVYVLRSKMFIGSDMDTFVKKHPFLFPETAEVKTGGASIFDCASSDCIGTADEGEKFCVFGEKDDLFLVRYNDTLCYLPMENVESEIKVTVQEFPAYDNTLELREQVVQYAGTFVGNPYVWGGTDLINGADCSGYVQSVMKEFGVDLPRTSAEQSECGREISLGDMKKGDLVFFNRGSGIGHVAIYAGSGKVLEAKGASYGIVLDSLDYSTVACARAVLD